MCKISNCGCDLHFHLHAEALLTQVFIPWSIYPSMLENCMRIFHRHPKINMCKTKLIFFSPHSSSFQKTDFDFIYVFDFNQQYRASLVDQMEKSLLAMEETQVRSLGQKGSLEKGMATHSSILAWGIPWT